MKIKSFRNRVKELVDKFLLVNLFLVIFLAIYFLFAILMQMNSIYIFINIFQIIWNPIIVPLITILIAGILLNGVISWFQRQEHLSKGDIEI